MDATLTSDVVVSVPARPDFVHVLRSVIAGVAARMDLSVEDIDDLRIALDEACAQMLEGPAMAERLTMRLTIVPGTLDVSVSTDGEAGEWPPPRGEDTLTWQVLVSLADAVRYELTDHGPALRFTKRIAPPGPGA